jgi:hypothetical protein
VRSVSDAFLAQLRGAHRMVTTCDVLFAGEVIAEDLKVAGGRIDYDRRASSLARCSVEFAEPLRLPDGGSTDVLSPYGYELQIRRGVKFRNGDTELVSLGVFPIQESDIDGVTLRTSVSALDRSQRVRDARLEEPYEIPAGTLFEVALKALVSGLSEGGIAVPSTYVSGIEYSLTSPPFTTPLLVFDAQADRWDAAQSMATATGSELYFNGDGRLTMRLEPDVRTAASVWDVDEGVDGVLISASVARSRRSAYNRVVAYSTNASTGEVFRGVATDDDPSSPTYYDGGFGRKPRFYASPLIASTAQAEASAASILRANLGVARSITLSAVTNPALEPGDVVRVARSSLGLDEVFVIDAMTIGLGPEDAMTVESRARQESS